MPVGKELWWTSEPARVKVVVEGITPMGSGSAVVLKVVEGATAAMPLRNATAACFSILSTKTFGDWAPLPAVDPFTHIPEARASVAQHIEPEGDGAAQAAATT